MISNSAWDDYFIWEHSEVVSQLYKKRCCKEVEELTCHQQAVELLAPYFEGGDSVLDVGCGSGYLYHSFLNKRMNVNYVGIDASKTLIEIGKKYMANYGLSVDQLKLQRIEDTDGEVDHVICVNVLSNIDNYHKPLERILKMAKKSVVIRESLSDVNEYKYVKDDYLDSDVDLKVHVNTYCEVEMIDFIKSYGFEVCSHEDRYTRGHPQKVIDYNHYWKFLVAQRSE